MFCRSIPSVFSSFAIILKGKRELGFFLVYCDCYCSVAFPYGAVGWSVVCDYDISQ